MFKISIVFIAAFMQFISLSQDIAQAKVFVSDFEDQPIIGSKIEFYDTLNQLAATGISDKQGHLQVALSSGLYTIKLKTITGTKDYAAIEIPTLSGREVFNNVQIHVQYKEEKSFTLDDLYFETNKSIIQQQSFDQLNELADYLKRKANTRIQINGHTDADGNAASNKRLSLERASAVKKYLIEQGIDASRIETNGFGATQPIADNSTDEGKAKNRRTEVQLLD
jgi:outer membrane protein OmpA-like peptidoglycan-associated protein